MKMRDPSKNVSGLQSPKVAAHTPTLRLTNSEAVRDNNVPTTIAGSQIGLVVFDSAPSRGGSM